MCVFVDPLAPGTVPCKTEYRHEPRDRGSILRAGQDCDQYYVLLNCYASPWSQLARKSVDVVERRKVLQQRLGFGFESRCQQPTARRT